MSRSDEAIIDSQPLLNWVRYSIYVQIIVALIGIWSGLLEYQLLADYASGSYLSELQAVADGEANDARQTIVGIVQLVVFIVSGFLILKWIYRANYTARQLGAEDMRFTPGWSVGWYFVPVALLWKPLQAMKEIWQASHDPANWQSVEVPNLPGWWWFFWIMTNVVSNMALRFSLRANEIDEFITANLIMQLADFLSIPLALVTMKLIMTIHKAQADTAKRLQYEASEPGQSVE